MSKRLAVRIAGFSFEAIGVPEPCIRARQLDRVHDSKDEYRGARRNAGTEMASPIFTESSARHCGSRR